MWAVGLFDKHTILLTTFVLPLLGHFLSLELMVHKCHVIVTRTCRHRSCLRRLAGSVYVTGEDAVTSGRVDVNANSDTQCSHAY